MSVQIIKNHIKYLLRNFKLNGTVVFWLVFSVLVYYLYLDDQKKSKKILEEIRDNPGFGYGIVTEVRDGTLKAASSLTFDIYVGDSLVERGYTYQFPGNIYCKKKLMGKRFTFVYSNKNPKGYTKHKPARMLILRRDYFGLRLGTQPDSLYWVNECFSGEWRPEDQ